MKWLFEREDFPQLIDSTAKSQNVKPAIIEKDYFVTELLRQLARDFGNILLFKGGTSLSKGWNLINRFSEDIDLYVEPGDKGEKARSTLLKEVIASGSSHPAFDALPETGPVIKGVARSVRFKYRSSRSSDGISPSVLLELGIQSGTFPTEQMPITSLLAAHLVANGVAPDQEDCVPFQMKLLHFRRTVVEKMFALHDKVARGLQQEGKPIEGYARHYYDLSQLLPRDEVRAMLGSSEYAEIVMDYHALTTKYFPNQVFPERLELSASAALFPDPEVAAALGRDYEQQCQILCHGDYPSFPEVLELLQGIRAFLKPVD